jgi:enterochelin esterase-like enzyme
VSSLPSLVPGRLAPHRRRVLRALPALAIAAWLAVGLVGVVRYGYDYWLYRGFKPPRVAAGVATGHVVDASFYSPTFHHTSSYLVYEPPGYALGAAARRRYPVMYVLHGHPGQAINILEAGSIGADLDQLLSEHQIKPMLLVMPLGDGGPEGGGDTEWAKTPSGNYDQLLVELVRSVDHRFATRANRASRVLAGLSSGAYAAINVGLHHLGLFGNLQCWSGYFIQQRGGAFLHASPALLRANSPQLYVARLASRIHRLGLNAFLYVGQQDHQTRIAQLGPFTAALRAAGANAHSATYPGAHDWAIWRQQMPHMLRLASHWTYQAPPRPHRHPRRLR